MPRIKGAAENGLVKGAVNKNPRGRVSKIDFAKNPLFLENASQYDTDMPMPWATPKKDQFF
jgi:hypothetical protein